MSQPPYRRMSFFRERVRSIVPGIFEFPGVGQDLREYRIAIVGRERGAYGRFGRARGGARAGQRETQIIRSHSETKTAG